MIGIPLGLVYGNIGEWLVHKHILHGLGSRPGSWWRFHLHEHHRAASVTGGRDPAYEHLRFTLNAQTREMLGLALAAAAHAPLFPVAPFFTATVMYNIANYYRVHRRSHLDPDWARANLPWHVDHHMGPDSECNWGVTHDWCDRWFGTRKRWVGTPDEAARSTQRRAAAV